MQGLQRGVYGSRRPMAGRNVTLTAVNARSAAAVVRNPPGTDAVLVQPVKPKKLGASGRRSGSSADATAVFTGISGP